MKPRIIAPNGMAAALVLLLTLFTALSSAAQTTGKENRPKADRPKDVDEALQQLQKAEAELQQTLKEADWKNIEQEIKAALQQARTDMAKAQIELQKSLKEINTDKIKAEMDKALQEAKAVDLTKVKEELNAALAKIDTEKIKAELDKAKTIDLEKIKAELDKAKPEIEASMQKAKESLEKAKAELKEYQTFVNTLAKDGLINKQEAYTIEIKEDRLIINGKVQPQEVYNKHRDFLEKHKGTTIKKSETDFNIYKD